MTSHLFGCPPGFFNKLLAGSLTCSPEARVITAWKVGSPYEIGLPPKNISADFKLRAESLGSAIRVEVFPGVGFADRFFVAFQEHQEPDVSQPKTRGRSPALPCGLGSMRT